MNTTRRRLLATAAMATAAIPSVIGPHLGHLLTELGLSGGADAASAASAMPAVTVERWVNSTPLTAEMLRGKVVLVDFWESGDPSEMVSRTTLARFTQAGVIPTSANAVICEVHRTWNRSDAAELAELYCMVSPGYRAVMESYQKAQEVIKEQANTNAKHASTATARR